MYNSITVDPTLNSISIDPTNNSLLVGLVNVEQLYNYVTPTLLDITYVEVG